MDLRLSALKQGLKATIGPPALRLPFNRRLRAYNVYEIPIEQDVLEDARTLYEHQIAPRLTHPIGPVRDGEIALYVQRPPWASDIAWWSADDAATYQHFKAKFFERLDLEAFRSRVSLDRDLRMYCAFFVVRSQCTRQHFHQDYVLPVRRQAYTLMTPLEEYPADDGHLAYWDALGRERIYRYRLGTAIVFGAGFFHSTQVMAPGPARVFLCFTFGTDQDRHWPIIQRSVYGQSRLLSRPGGELVLDAVHQARAHR